MYPGQVIAQSVLKPNAKFFLYMIKNLANILFILK